MITNPFCFFQGTLFYRRLSKKNFENVDVVNVETLKITSRTQFVLPHSREICNVIFSDGEALNIITTKDVRQRHLSVNNYTHIINSFTFRKPFSSSNCKRARVPALTCPLNWQGNRFVP